MTTCTLSITNFDFVFFINSSPSDLSSLMERLKQTLSHLFQEPAPKQVTPSLKKIDLGRIILETYPQGVFVLHLKVSNLFYM